MVTKVENRETSHVLYVEMERTPHICPECGQETDRIHDYRTQAVKELPIWGKTTVLMVRKRRYVCPECGKRFYETNPMFGRYQRMTQRMRAYLISRFSQMRSGKSIAEECGCSSATAFRLFDEVSHPRPHLPPTISIDEFKGNAGGHKYQCILTNPKKKKILDVMESRNQEELLQYFASYPNDQRNNVAYVVMDMSALFRSVARQVFPRAKIVADKFHVCRLVTWALERTRIKAQTEFAPWQRKYFKKSRWILLKKQADLTEESKQQLETMLTLSQPIREAYLLKERFYEFLDSADRTEAARRLSAWMLFAGSMELPEFRSVIRTLGEWSNEILHAFDTGLSNGFTEGMNNRTKVLKRTCYGVRNFQRFRNRILYLSS